MTEVADRTGAAGDDEGIGEGEGHPQRWLVLIVVLLGQTLITGSMGIMNVALASIRDDLGASGGAIQWVIVLYQLGFATVLITGGRLGDMLGRKRVFIIGLTGYVAASALAAVAPNVTVLIVARLFQGLFGGVTAPQVLAVIQVAFPPSERPRAFAAFGTVNGSGFMVGQLMSGVLIRLDPFGLGWRSPFLVGVALGVVAVVTAVMVLPETPVHHQQKLDLVGVALASTGGLLVLYPLIQGRSAGWPPAFLLMLLVAAPILVAFLRWERRLTETGGQPLVDFSLFKARSFRAGLIVAVAYSFSTLPTFYTLTLTLQLGFGYDALEAALATAATPVAVIAVSMWSAKLLPRYGRKVMAAAACFGTAASFAIMATMAWAPRPLNAFYLVPALLLLGCNNGLGMTAVVNLTLTDVPDTSAGSASGLMQTVQQSSSAMGVALAGIVFFGVVGTATSLQAHVDGMTAALWITIFSCGAVFGLHFLLPPKAKPVEPEDVADAMASDLGP